MCAKDAGKHWANIPPNQGLHPQSAPKNYHLGERQRAVPKTKGFYTHAWKLGGGPRPKNKAQLAWHNFNDVYIIKESDVLEGDQSIEVLADDKYIQHLFEQDGRLIRHGSFSIFRFG